MAVNGNVPVQRMKMPDNQQAAVDMTVAKMKEIATGIYGSRSPKIRALAIDIVRKYRVPEKDYYGEILAIHDWVKKNIRYTKDVVGQETLSYPEETAFNSKAGDCDDMTVLEMALLESIGIPSFPVTIGVKPGLYSHVYLKAVVPPGKHRMANKVVPLDPIMKQWPAGKEAPAHRVKIKKEYTENPSMSGYDDDEDLGDMLSGLSDPLGEYYEGPSYLDTEHSEAENLLVADDFDSALNGNRTMTTTAHADVPMDGMDAMFGMGAEDPDVVDTSPEFSTTDPDTRYNQVAKRPAGGDTDEYYRLFNYGPLYNRAAQLTNEPIQRQKAYEGNQMNSALNQQRGKAPVKQVRSSATVKTVLTQERVPVDLKTAPKNGAEEIVEIENTKMALRESAPAAKAAAKKPVQPGSAEAKAVRRAAILTWLLQIKAGIQEVLARSAEQDAKKRGIGAGMQESIKRRKAANNAKAAAKEAVKLEKELAKNPTAAKEIITVKESLNIDQAKTGTPVSIDAAADTGEMTEFEETLQNKVEISRGGRNAGAEVKNHSRGINGKERSMLMMQKGRDRVENKINALEERVEITEARENLREKNTPTLMAPIDHGGIVDPAKLGRKSFISRSYAKPSYLATPFAMPSFLNAARDLGELPTLPVDFLPPNLQNILGNAAVQYSLGTLAAVMAYRYMKKGKK